MGCGGSKKHEHGRNSLAEKQISVHIGDQVKVPEAGPILIFVFGGPGSKKGRLVSELVETYGFGFINVEKLLLNHLLKKVPENERVGASFDAQDVIKEDPHLVSLEWLLGEVSRQMAHSDGDSSRFIVDIMPNLKFLINNDIFLSDCTSDMKNFEQQHPITFAINFVQRSAKKSKKEADTPKDKEQKAAVRSDEADSSRTRRRITLFDNNVRPFIDYFQQSDRLISMDVTGAETEAMWARLCELFTSLHIHSLAHVNCILVFIFDSQQLELVTLEQEELQVIRLKSLVDGSNASLMTFMSLLLLPVQCFACFIHLSLDRCAQTDTVSALCKHLDKWDPLVRTFLIDVTDTCLTSHQQEQQSENHSIVFVDEEVGQLPKFVARSKARGGQAALKFRAVSSTEDRVCLFPCHVPLTVCKDIALLLGDHSQH